MLLVSPHFILQVKFTQKFNSFQGIVFISAKENQQIDELKKALVAKTIQGDLQTESTIITNARHFDALQKLAESLQDVQGGLDENISSDLLALDIRQCLHYLGSITGQITNEDQLDFIFSKFCSRFLAVSQGKRSHFCKRKK